jgi:16S rRNA (cytosine967-C5)-methyltransferase
MTTGRSARSAAVMILDEVLGQGVPLSQILDGSEFLASLPAPDRARAQRLAVQVIRQLEPIERLLEPRLRKAPPLHIMNILRLAVWERVAGAPAHGVVNGAVDLARHGNRNQHLSGMVNAVLRGLPEDVTLSGRAQRMPRWLRQPLVHAYGREAVSAIEAVHAQTPPVDLTIKGEAIPEGVRLPNGSLRLVDGGQLSALAGYATGDWWVQDVAASMAVPMLRVTAGQRVLDICAAPGGKTMQLAALGAEVTALDISGPRMARVAENLARTGLTAHLITTDALHYVPDAPFDAVLLDAPCSATGTIRRHPELPYLKDGSEIAGLAVLQSQLLDRALGMVKSGGNVVFCTCSLLPAEGEDQLAAALIRHPDLRVLPPLGVDPAWITAQGGLRLRPDYWGGPDYFGGMDGFFMVCLQKP